MQRAAGRAVGRLRGRVGGALVLCAILVFIALLPLVGTGSGIFFWEEVGVYTLFAISTNLLIGHSGIPSFGQAAFFGVGAYGVGLLSTSALPVPIVLVICATAAGAAAALVGVVVSRLNGMAVAMFTLAIGQTLYLFVGISSPLGGENGIPGIVPHVLLGINLDNPAVYWYICAGCCALGVSILWLVYNSPLGLMLHAIRDDAKRATYLGLNVRFLRLLAFVISGWLCGLAGGLLAYASGIVSSGLLDWTNSGEAVIMAAIGGLDSFWGPGLGAIIYLWITNELANITQNWLFFVGVILLAVVFIVPRGLISVLDRVREFRGVR